MMAHLQQVSVLLIDDDQRLAALLSDFLEASDFSLSCAHSGEEGLRRLCDEPFDIVILDVMLPGLDGFDILDRIRLGSQVPVLMLTTRNAGEDRVRGLQSGADDYLAKPFQPQELTARMQAILRRVRGVGQTAFEAEDVHLDTAARSVRVAGRAVTLTGAEFSLLHLLMRRVGEPIRREELIRCVFGREAYGIDRSIDNLVTGLRKKLGPNRDGSDRLRSIRGLGYLFVTSLGGGFES